jgi:hypothetical protein
MGIIQSRIHSGCMASLIMLPGCIRRSALPAGDHVVVVRATLPAARDRFSDLSQQPPKLLQPDIASCLHPDRNRWILYFDRRRGTGNATNVVDEKKERRHDW